ncbi:MAG: nucleoside triphosphate pyrophosphohydrolase [Verrucomicrobiota bacterium]|nr:nucleoside triphosphate pyrophosphohydrolase [Verrucomicrobiota bacterium]
MTNAIDELRKIVARLRAPDGCPWDREQTHETLRGSLVEEAYEAVEAIDQKNDSAMCEELGDLLLLVVMHSQLAAESKRFDLDEVARGVSEKLIRRHPHVFGNKNLQDSGAVLKQWDEIKRAEKGGAPSVLDGVSTALPALMRAEKVQKRAARVGFDWENLADVLNKIREELTEIEAELDSGNRARLEEEIGDLIFSVANLARKAELDCELLLQRATEKFAGRFRKLESILAQRGKTFAHANAAELDAIWNEAKTR